MADFEILKDYKAVPNPDYVEPPAVYRCYDCGSTEGFYDERDYWGNYVDCHCSKCDSPNTSWDGEGEPQCQTCWKTNGWECIDCNQMTCEECWTWGKLGDVCEHCGCDK